MSEPHASSRTVDGDELERIVVNLKPAERVAVGYGHTQSGEPVLFFRFLLYNEEEVGISISLPGAITMRDLLDANIDEILELVQCALAIKQRPGGRRGEPPPRN